MTESRSSGAQSSNEQKLPSRDWFLLPTLSLLTIFLFSASAVLGARLLFPSSMTGMESCRVKGTATSEATTVPNTVCSERAPESRFLAEYRFNRCGHRAAMECGAKPPGTYRIVMIGTSVAMGMYVPEQMTIAALLPAELSRETGRKIDLYNEGGRWPFIPRNSGPPFDEIQAAQPDMILWVLSPADFKFAYWAASAAETATPAMAQARQGNPLGNALNKMELVLASLSSVNGLRALVPGTKAALVLTHLLYEAESREQYVASYLKNDDYDAGFLKAEQTSRWQTSLRYFDNYAAEMAERAGAAGVPLVVVLVPLRAQAAMISMGQWPKGYDPYKLDNELRSIIESHGGIYITILPDFRSIPNPEKAYFPVDGHPNDEGHALIAGLLAKKLARGALPAGATTTRPQAGSMRRR